MSSSLAHAQAAYSPWKGLYRAGGIAALIVVVLIPLQAFLFIAFPPPSTVVDYFSLFQQNPFLGFVDLDLLLTLDNLLMILLYLALYAALRRASEAGMAVALTLGLVGTVLYLVSREATFSMLSLSNQYAAATTEAQRAPLLAAGQMLLTVYNGTAFNLSYVLGGVTLLLISAVMLRSDTFSRATAYVGLAMGALMLVPPTLGPAALVVSLLSLVPTLIWLILVARRFLQLGRRESV